VTRVIVALTALASVGLSYAGVAALRRWLVQRSVLDIPNERSSHAQPTPRGGGLMVLIVMLAGLLVLAFAGRSSPTSNVWSVAGVGLGVALVAGVSWWDDLRSVSFRVRFAVHIVAAVLAVASAGAWHVVTLPGIGDVALGWAAGPVTLLWIVGLTSAYNFMDGIDGLAGGQAVIAGLGWGVLGWLTGHPFLATVGFLAAGASLGFLGHNWHPASIFMGDVGSATLGYLFAVMSVAGAQRSPSLAWAGFLLVWPFVFDTAFTLLRRIRLGEDVFQAHRSHLYQRLVRTGVSQSATAFLYICLSTAGGVTAIALAQRGSGAADAVGRLFPLLALALWAFVALRERARRQADAAGASARV
jgi:UDP-N-acetylmuramyl pentapeptide phosphotransferase/UDP-N-acetylglucosamine-1-phosphate transferase